MFKMRLCIRPMQSYVLVNHSFRTFGLPHGQQDVDVDGEYHCGDDDGGEGAGGDVGKVGREEGAAMME